MAERFPKRTDDYLFKWMFSSPERKDLLLSFVNSVLSDGADYDVLADLELRDREIDPDKNKGKSCRLDILGITPDGTQVDIEVQTTNKGDIDRRSLYYWAHLFAGQMESGGSYVALRPVIIINLLTFSYFKNRDAYHSRYEIQECSDHERLNEALDLHFIELPKWTKLTRKAKNRLERWLLFFADNNPGEMEEIAMTEELFAKALEVERAFKMDPKARREYDLLRQAEIDYNADIAAAKLTARKEGHEEGKKEGHEEGKKEGHEEGFRESRLEMVRNMFKINMPLDQIAQISQLPVDQLRQLRA